jgi:hypothetical protein
VLRYCLVTATALAAILRPAAIKAAAQSIWMRRLPGRSADQVFHAFAFFHQFFQGQVNALL